MNNLLQAAKITIIGGADGPTSIYVTSKWSLIILLVIVILIAFAIYKLISWYLKKLTKESEKNTSRDQYRKRKKKCFIKL